MFYWFDKTLPMERRQAMAERLAFWCDKAMTDHGMPVPYTITFATGAIASTNNSQHALWAAKMFFDHYERTGDPRWFDRAREIADWVIANMVVGTTPNRRIKRFTDQNFISIKTIASGDVLVKLTRATGDASYKAVFDEHVAWMQANAARVTGVDWLYSEVDSDTPAIARTVDNWHCNLEMVGGLLDAFDADGDTKYYDLAESVYAALLHTEWDWVFGETIDPMTAFQTAFLGRRLGRVDACERSLRYGLSLRRQDGGFHANLSTGTSNIFPHTYLLAALHYANPEQADEPVVPPALAASFALGRSYGAGGEQFTGRGSANIDHEFGNGGLRIITTSGGASATIEGDVDLDDFALVIALTLNETVTAAKGIIRVLDDDTNNDVYLLANTEGRIVASSRINGSSQVVVNNFDNPLTIGRQLVLTVRIANGIVINRVVNVAAQSSKTERGTYATTLGVASDPTLTLGPVATVVPALATIHAVRVWSPAPPPELLGIVARSFARL